MSQALTRSRSPRLFRRLARTASTASRAECCASSRVTSLGTLPKGPRVTLRGEGAVAGDKRPAAMDADPHEGDLDSCGEGGRGWQGQSKLIASPFYVMTFSFTNTSDSRLRVRSPAAKAVSA